MAAGFVNWSEGKYEGEENEGRGEKYEGKGTGGRIGGWVVNCVLVCFVYGEARLGPHVTCAWTHLSNSLGCGQFVRWGCCQRAQESSGWVRDCAMMEGGSSGQVLSEEEGECGDHW